jgi:phytoene desaturase
MINIINAMINICKDQGVVFMSNKQVKKINIVKNTACSLTLDDNEIIKSDIIIGSADYAHVETLLDKQYRNYTSQYWEKRILSPSSLIFYLGINRKINKLIHHNLFFNEDIEQHTNDIYLHKKWPKKPLFYVCCPSKTDPTVAPLNKENIFILIPIAAGLKDNTELRKKYFNYTIGKLEEYCNQDIKKDIEFKRSYCIQDFEKDYNAFKGNAFGLANTLMQTANLKPKIINKKVNNLYYTGQLTVPGPGVPPAIISGELVAKHIFKKNKKRD